MRTMAAGKFKATCLAVMDEVQMKREPVVITKNGKPVAKMVPMELAEDEDPLAKYRFPGTIEIVGDIVSSEHTDEEWEQIFEDSMKSFDPE